MDSEEGEFEICGSSSNPEDIQFDELVGCIEDFMISFDMEASLKALPSHASIPNEHEVHNIFRSFLEEVESEMDQHVLAHCSAFKTITEVGDVLQKRHDEISDEVWEFVSEGCLDFETFVTMWKTHSP